MDPSPPHALALEQFGHVRVIIGLVTGLSMTRLLTGLAGFVQHPSRRRIYPVHLGWSIFLLLGTLHFWWFEFGLGVVPIWTFQLYVFVVGYAALFFFTCTLIFPDRLDEYSGFEEYFHARQAWFFGLLAAIFLVDLADTAIKGAAYSRSFGPIYPVRQLVGAALAIVAIFVRNRRFHAALVIAALLGEVWWILSQYELLA